MEKEYNDLKEFWNSCFESLDPKIINSKWITSIDFNETIEEYLPNNSKVLDYGCGDGWASFEIYNTKSKEIKEIIGIDQSINAINYAKKVSELSAMSNVKFLNGDEMILDEYQDYFDFVMSFNCFDVVPNEIVDSILTKIHKAMKVSSFAFIGLNHDFETEELTSVLGMEKRDKYFFKDGILRCNKKKIIEWEMLFSKYFKVIDAFEFSLTEKEKEYPRMGYILKRVD